MSETAPRVESLEFKGPAGILEGILRLPATDIRRAALLCHPHPLYEGSMHSPVIFRAARALHHQGYATLRFNFRGVGRSRGEFNGGIGEKGDVLAALTVLSGRVPGVPVSLLGYSFGSRVGFEAAARDSRIDALIGIGMPLILGSFDFLVEAGRPLLAIQGERDEYGAPQNLERLIESLGPPSKLVVIAGANHCFEGRLDAYEISLHEALTGFSGWFP
jgi:alpha/beta superfamily hydrolase